MIPTTLGQRIAYFRKKTGLSQRDLAAAVGVSPSTLCGYEQDVHEPSVATLMSMAKILNRTCDALLDSKPYPDLTIQNNAECDILRAFRNLNDLGQEMILEYASFLLGTPKYANG